MLFWGGLLDSVSLIWLLIFFTNLKMLKVLEVETMSPTALLPPKLVVSFTVAGLILASRETSLELKS